MDRKAKSLKLLGGFGILGEAFKIIRCRPKLLGAITLLSILPLTLINLAQSLVTPLFLAEMIVSNQTAEQPTMPVLKLMGFLILELVYATFFYAAMMPSMAAVVYTVANVYRGNHNHSFARVVRFVPAVWKHMMKTFLWYFIITFMIGMAFGSSVCFLAAGFIVFGYSYVVVFYVELMAGCVVLFLVSVYVGIVWQMASVLSIMEERCYGLEGMKKSRRLLEGKGTTAWVLTISYLLINELIGHIVVKRNFMHVVGLRLNMTYGIAYVMMACLLGLLGVLTQSVLYFVCKSYHGESIDGYLNEYEAVNNKEMESLEA
ncbi:hypothetical protein SUGI_1197260 [Cryptomeria japonica]|uniref:uncharacterized protein LOC131079015 n=1 Tax=Cryptomeria japonica TaxID=3369 RepID=UPI002414824A|nr:uncharacterized protein LOC131079015 [Cryptomeria japonica]GLJ55748.1 hypothetical protein SUGI_1197260 [Cryptomeria japonica]